MADADETIVTRFVVETADALAQAQKFREQVDALKVQLQQLVQQSKMSVSDVAEGMKRARTGLSLEDQLDPTKVKNWGKALSTAASETQQEFKKSEQSAKGLDTELKSKPKDAGAVSSAFSRLGDVAKVVFGTILGLSAIRALRDLFGWFQKIAEQGLEFAKSMYKAGVAINALRFQGVNASIAQTVKWIEELRKEFGVLSEKEALDIISTTQLLTRNLGFTADKIQNVIKWATALGVVQGKDVAETARQVVLFLSSGYGEGLQKAGIAVNRFVVAQKAMELGFGKSYMALTEQQRALAGYAVLEQQMGNITEQAAKYQETMAGQIEETTKSIDTLTTEMGVRLIPIKKLWVELQLTIVNTINKAAKSITQLLVIFIEMQKGITRQAYGLLATFGATGDLLINIIEQKFMGPLTQMQLDLADFAKNFNLADEMAKSLEEGDLGTPTLEIKPELDPEAMQKGVNDLVELVQKSNQDIIEAERDLQQDLAKIDAEGAVERNKIWEDYYADVAKITSDESGAIADATEKLQQDLADLQSDTQSRLQDAARKYREDEIKAERDYQERLRRLREEYLFDLEDALRERDALQVLRLMRRYQLDKEQEGRQYEQDKKDRQQAYRDEIADIREQAAKRRAELQREYQQRIADIHEQANKERAEAAAKRDEELADLEQKIQTEKQEREAAYRAELEAIVQRFKDDTAAILEGLGQQYDISKTGLEQLSNIFTNILGNGGPIANAYQQFSNTVQNINQTIADATAQAIANLQLLEQVQMQANALQSSYYPPSYTGDTKSGHAAGGTFLATKPTWALYGEAGPEYAQFTPLNKMRGGEGGGKASIEVWLSKDLEARIVDNTLNQSAQIIEESLSRR